MYQDPKRVRTRYAALNLDQYEALGVADLSLSTVPQQAS